jgi:hypothetical protein
MYLAEHLDAELVCRAAASGGCSHHGGDLHLRREVSAEVEGLGTVLDEGYFAD